MKGQYSIVYLGLFILMSLVFLGGVLSLGGVVEKVSGEQVAEQLAETIFMRIEKAIVDIRVINNYSQSEYVVKEVDIPERIRSDTYAVFCRPDRIQIQTHGKNSILKTYNLTWWDVNLTGSAFSSNQKVTLNYSAANHTITLS